MVSEISVQALTIAKRPSSARTTFPLSSVQNQVPSFSASDRLSYIPVLRNIQSRYPLPPVPGHPGGLCLTPARRSLWIIHHRNHTPAVSPSHSWQNKAENLLHSILQSFLPASSGQKSLPAALLFSSASFINAVFLSEILTTAAKALWEDSSCCSFRFCCEISLTEP